MSGLIKQKGAVQVLGLYLLLALDATSSLVCPNSCKCKHTSEETYNVLCSNTAFQQVPDFSSLQSIKEKKIIDLSSNKIESISKQDFPRSPKLNVKELDLSQNKEMEMDTDSFLNIASSLRKLSLEAVGLTFDRPLRSLSELRVLRELSLSHNNRRGYIAGAVEHVDVRLFEGPVTHSLKVLRMSHCGMRSLSGISLDSLVNLEEIDLSNNWFTSFPPAIQHLRDLKTLFLFHCSISSLEDYGFSSLSNLEVIDMNSNNLKSIGSQAFRGLENSLKKLKLERCNLKEIPSAALKHLKKLEYLDLSQNSFTAAPASSFVGDYCLNTLLISADNLHLETNSFRGQRECVKDLTLKQMKLRTIPTASLLQLKKLSSISFDHNEIRTLRSNAFSGLTARIISLANNPLTTIEDGAFLGLPPNLDINLRRTKISGIDFLIGYPEDAIQTVNLDYAELDCRCSMKSSLNATISVDIFGSCRKGPMVLPLSSSRLPAILDTACEEESALNTGSGHHRMAVGLVSLFHVILYSQ